MEFVYLNPAYGRVDSLRVADNLHLRRVRARDHGDRPRGSAYGWFGTLINNKEDATGTFYRRNRYLDPTTGRFTQEDPIGLAGGLNLYGFANGDPVNFSDASGHWLNADRAIARNACLTIAAGDAAAFECGDLRLVHAFPRIRTFNATKAPTLLYNSEHAHPHPRLLVRVVVPSAIAMPDSVYLTLRVNGVIRDGLSLGTQGWMAGVSRYYELDFDALSFGTGVYQYEIEGRMVDVGQSSYSRTVASELIVLNRSQSYFGAGWWLAGYEEIYFTSGNRLLWIGGDGSARVYTNRSAYAWVAEAVDRPDTIIGNDENYYRRAAQGVVVGFDQQGRHISTRSRLGYYTTFVRDGSSKLAYVQHELPSAGNLLFYDFVYGGSGVLDSVKTRGLGAPVRATRTFYSGGHLDSLRDADGTKIRFGYDPGGQHLVTSRTNQRGYVTTFGFDASRQTLNQSSHAMVTEPNIVSTFSYVTGAGDSLPPRWEYDGPRTDVTDVTKFWLSRFGAPVRIEDPVGAVTEVATDDPRWPALPTRVRRLSTGAVVAAAYDARGNLASVADSNPYDNGQHPTTTYLWNQAWDQLTQVTLPNGQLTRFGVDSYNGNHLWVEDARGATSRTTFQYYNAPGNSRYLLSAIVPPTGAQTAITYDLLGNTASVATGGWTTYYQNDSAGRTRVVRTPIASNTYRNDSTAYDLADRVIRSTSYAPAVGGAPAELVSVIKKYDEAGNLDTLMMFQSPDPTSLGWLTTAWGFDAADRPRFERATDGRRDSTWYDPAGNVTVRKTRNGHPLTMTYDVANRLIQRVVPAVTYAARTSPGMLVQLMLRYDGDPDTRPYPWYPNDGSGLRVDADTARYTYDVGGRLIAADNRDARVRRTFFKTGQVQTDSLWIRNYADQTFSHRYGLRYSYDLNGRVRALRHPAQLAYGPEMRDSVWYGYSDITGEITQVTTLLGQAITFLYNTRGELVRKTLPGGIVDSMVYDNLGRLTLNRVANGSTSPYKDPDAFLRYTTLQYGLNPMLVSSALNTRGWKDTVQAAYTGLGHLRGLTYRRPQNVTDTALYVYIGGDGASQSYNLDPLANSYSSYVTSSGNLGYGSSFMGGSTGGSSYQNGTGRGTATWDAGGNHGFVYDSAGNTVFFYETHLGGTILNDRASWYGADGALRVAEMREAFDPSQQWQNAGWTDRFEEYRYDAFGRRVLVMSRWACWFGADSVGYANCNQSRVRRTVWDGSRELWEIQMPARTQDASLIENDTATVTYWAGTQWDLTWADPNPLFGRVAYTYAGGVDRPVSITRLKLVRRKSAGDTRYWNPVELRPLWNWRGEADIGTFQDGGMKTCTDATHCAFVQWRGVAFSTGLARELLWTPLYGWSPYGWFGTLINSKEDATGTYYRRYRHLDPATGRFTQEDPIGIAGGLNLYGFANGDPVNFSDPFGLWCERRADRLHCENLGPGDFRTIRDYLGGEAGQSAFRTFEAAGWTQWSDETCQGGFSSAQCTQLAGSFSKLTLHSDNRCSSLGVSATKRFQAGRFRLRSNVAYLGYAQKFWPWGQIRLNAVLFGERAGQLTEIVAHEASHFHNPFAGGGPLGIFHGFGDSIYRLGEYCGR